MTNRCAVRRARRRARGRAMAPRLADRRRRYGLGVRRHASQRQASRDQDASPRAVDRRRGQTALHRRRVRRQPRQPRWDCFGARRWRNRRGLVFLVMDLLQGQTLEERLRRSTTPCTLATFSRLLVASWTSWKRRTTQGIVHRDIKPANIFLVHDGAVKLLDFGIARLTSPGHPTTTQWGVTMGTPTFMAPEQARGHWEQVDGRTDLWALGASMFMALTGRPVHAAETTNEELLSAMTKRAPSIATWYRGAQAPRRARRSGTSLRASRTLG